MPPALPKRFPDREEIAMVWAEAADLEPGAEGNDEHSVAGRVLARRDLGKLMFLDLVDRSGRIQLLVRPEDLGGVDLDLGDVIGVRGIATRTKRGEPSLAVLDLQLLGKIRTSLPDTFHGLTDTEARFRRRYLDLLMNEESRRDVLVRSKMIASISGTWSQSEVNGLVARIGYSDNVTRGPSWHAFNLEYNVGL